MWIVQLARRRPYTFVVMALLIAILGGVTIKRMATDIFPEIDIPIVSARRNYSSSCARHVVRICEILISRLP
jgi:multidrug efflux pump subunit AcrB